MPNTPPVKLTKKQTLIQTVKYFLFAASAGLIQGITFTILTETGVFRDSDRKYGPSYLIALVLSVIWNFTFNRKFTFKSIANVPIAMLKVFGYYCVFTPISTWWGNKITGMYPDLEWVQYATLVGTLLINGVTEFLFYRFVIFRNSINTNESGKKEEAKKSG
ncbi:MAG: GtrA family protein [Oscillospiraceae bacterium]|jgi:putative flippase GtrA|nr:GtrA family protein [Oscillospiraceae bacterium]